jgi:hypothetical protein
MCVVVVGEKTVIYCPCSSLRARAEAHAVAYTVLRCVWFAHRNLTWTVRAHVL